MWDRRWKRRGLRWEVNEPSDRQVRNKRWLANHPVATAAVGAAAFGALGSGYAMVSPKQWLTLPVGALIGLVLGVLIGWGFSVEHRDDVPRGWRFALYAAGVGLVGVVLIAMELA